MGSWTNQTPIVRAVASVLSRVGWALDIEVPISRVAARHTANRVRLNKTLAPWQGVEASRYNTVFPYFFK
jgi:hypothetical protein